MLEAHHRNGGATVDAHVRHRRAGQGISADADDLHVLDARSAATAPSPAASPSGASILTAEGTVTTNARCRLLGFKSPNGADFFGDASLPFDWVPTPSDWRAAGVVGDSVLRVTNRSTTTQSFILFRYANFLDPQMCNDSYPYETWLRRP